MRQTTKTAFAALTLATVVGSIGAMIAKLLMALVDVYYPGWGTAAGIAMIAGVIGCAFIAFEGGWLD